MSEADRLAGPAVARLNAMDRVWVPSEFNRETFVRAGVHTGKLAVIPGAIDPAFLHRGDAETQRETDWNWVNDDTVRHLLKARASARPEVPHSALCTLHSALPFVLLTVFDWTLHKGWDVLLRAFLEAFEGRDDVLLALKVWSSLGYGAEGIRRQAADFARRELGRDLLADPRIRFLTDRVSRAQLRSLYQAADAFVLPSRGEGWGRTYMEAMACGLPTIGTNWSGNTAFMTPENSCLLDYRLVPVPEVGWREIPAYRGHRWAEPHVEHLKALLLQVVENTEQARAVGEGAREDVLERFNLEAVGRQMAETLARLGAGGPNGRSAC